MKRVAASVEDLLAGATRREPMVAADSKSGAVFERVEIEGGRYVVKHIALHDDWIARAMGDIGRWPILVWTAGLLDTVPDTVDHAYVAVANGADSAAVLMRDVSDVLVPEGDTPIAEADHAAFIDTIAGLHAAFWGWEDRIGLTPFGNRFFLFSPWMVACEEALGFPAPVTVVARDGWERLAEVAPGMHTVLQPLTVDPSPLAVALETTPMTFCHGDTKMGNLGRNPDGRTVMIDWSLPGRSAGAIEVAHYLALNRARIPASCAPEDTIALYREGLVRRGIDVEPWFDRQVALALLAMMVLLGWEKALGPSVDLPWWEDRVEEGARLLG